MTANPARNGQNWGLVEGALLKLLTRPATVTRVEPIGDRFRLVTLGGPALCGVSWSPGQKVQIQFGGWTQRTYTPLSWDSAAGSAQLFAYAHGEGPGSDWVRSVQAGDPCMLFGPRRSLDLDALEVPGMLFGDETSLGLAHALRFSRNGTQGVDLLFETTDLATTRGALERIGLSDAELVERLPGDTHLHALEGAASSLVRAHSLKSCVLSGKATSIRHLGKHLRTLGMSSRQIQTRAYWSPGKKGLD